MTKENEATESLNNGLIFPQFTRPHAYRSAVHALQGPLDNLNLLAHRRRATKARIPYFNTPFRERKLNQLKQSLVEQRDLYPDIFRVETRKRAKVLYPDEHFDS